ncbi:MAG TPA: hypothetical protein VHM90_04445, partial [Phycisphaerae bacterium]|nr:hypothetical protein [Phycisphaerae bacterium]
HQITLTFGAMTEEETAGRLFLQHRKIEWANIADVAVNPRFRESVPDPPAGGKGIIAADKESFPNQPGEFYIMGNVGRPGVYSLTGRKITIKQALAAAAMDIEKAKDFEVTLIRRTGASETKATVNVGAILAGDEPDRYLQANDLIQVKRTAATTATAPASRP